MSMQILMPALSPTMEEGKLAKWLVKEGDEVHSGDILAEIETDKATMEFEAVDEGKIGKILVPEGTEGVKVNAPIADRWSDGEGCRAPSATAARAATPNPRSRRVEPSLPPARARNAEPGRTRSPLPEGSAGADVPAGTEAGRP